MGGFGSPPWGQSIYKNYLEFFCTKGWSTLPLFHHLFTHLFKSAWTHGYLYFYFRSSSNTTLFWCLNCCSSGHWECFSLDPVSLWHSPIIIGLVFWLSFIFPHVLTFWHYRMLQAHLVSFMPQSWGPRISHFSTCWFFLLESDIRNQDLGTSYGCDNWGVINSKPS